MRVLVLELPDLAFAATGGFRELVQSQSRLPTLIPDPLPEALCHRSASVLFCSE